MFIIPTVEELLKAGAHFGHRVGKWNPKMASFLFGERKGIHIINIEDTRRELENALRFVRDLSARGGTIVFVGTKKQAQAIIKKYAEECTMPYIIERWLGGTLTNFPVIFQVIKKYRTLKERLAKGELKRYTKKEQSNFQKEIEKHKKLVGGLENLNKLPDALFIVDVRAEDTAVREANRKGLPIVAICDSNVDPSKITKPIPANDDATKTIEIISSLISQAVKEGKELAKKEGTIKEIPAAQNPSAVEKSFE